MTRRSRSVAISETSHSQTLSFLYDDRGNDLRNVVNYRIWAVVAGLILVVTDLLYYSRILTIVWPTIATLGITLIGVALAFFAMVNHKRTYAVWALYSLVLATWLLYTIWRFHYLTGVDFDSRSIGVFSGLFFIFVGALLFQVLGVNNTLRCLLAIGVLYCVLYCVLALELSVSGSLGAAARANAILYDPGRGARLFSDTTVIAYVILFSLYNVVRLKNPLLNFPILAVGVFALVLAQSRMSILAICLVAGLLVIRLDRLLGLIAGFLAATFVILNLIVAQFAGDIARILLTIDANSLGMRANSLNVVKYVNSRWPFLGIGYPTSPDSYVLLIHQPFFPEDLGGLGIITNFGIFGLCFIGSLLAALGVGIQKLALQRDTTFFGYVGLYIIIYGFTWPTILYGDGALFLSFIGAYAIHEHKVRSAS